MTKLFTVSVAVFFLTAALARGQQPHAYAIRCGKFIDGKGDRAQDNITIIVEGNIIRSAGKDVKIPAEAELIDLSNHTFLHAHSTSRVRTHSSDIHGSFICPKASRSSTASKNVARRCANRLNMAPTGSRFMLTGAIIFYPTLFVTEYVAEGRAREARPIYGQMISHQRKAFAKAVKAGLKIALGTDVGGFAFDSLEIESDI